MMNPATLEILIQSIGGHIVFPTRLFKDDREQYKKFTR